MCHPIFIEIFVDMQFMASEIFISAKSIHVIFGEYIEVPYSTPS